MCRVQDYRVSDSVLRKLKSAIGSLWSRQTTTRLGDFTFEGRIGPIVALVVVAGTVYAMDGFSAPLRTFLQLCAAFAVAFLPLFALGKIKGLDASWRWIIPTAALGVCLGGLASASIALAPEWAELGSISQYQRDWEIGAAFSAFFVGLSLVTSAVRQSEHSEFETRQRLLEARLKMLSARIEPHFLMNSLANLRYLIRSDPSTAHEMLDHLSEFLQGAIERSRDIETTLGQEAQLIESYLRIMQIRLGDRLQYQIDIPDHLNAVRLPALLLQTLVENAVTHGIEPADRMGLIEVRAVEDAGRIGISVSDDGVGFEQENVRPGVGLRNVAERLNAFYDAAAGFNIEAREGGGTIAIVTVPMEKV